ncbi:hypothetical protein L3V86_04190 [Thiotrichales bacterium 19S11-10]|nr:hypothetical protein [Thiotrichales bacterium 19S11-10]
MPDYEPINQKAQELVNLVKEKGKKDEGALLRVLNGAGFSNFMMQAKHSEKAIPVGAVAELNFKNYNNFDEKCDEFLKLVGTFIQGLKKAQADDKKQGVQRGYTDDQEIQYYCVLLDEQIKRVNNPTLLDKSKEKGERLLTRVSTMRTMSAYKPPETVMNCTTQLIETINQKKVDNSQRLEIYISLLKTLGVEQQYRNNFLATVSRLLNDPDEQGYLSIIDENFKNLVENRENKASSIESQNYKVAYQSYLKQLTPSLTQQAKVSIKEVRSESIRSMAKFDGFGSQKNTVKETPKIVLVKDIKRQGTPDPRRPGNDGPTN